MPDPLGRAISLYHRQEFSAAERLLAREQRRGRMSAKRRAKLFIWRGMCQYFLGGEEAARECFHRAVAVDPAIRLPRSGSPLLARLLAEVKQRLRAPVNPKRIVAAARRGAGVTVSLGLARRGVAGKPLLVLVTVSGLRAGTVWLWYRPPGKQAYRSRKARLAGARVRIEIPAVVPAGAKRPVDVGVFVEVRDGKGRVRARSGSRGRPRLVLVHPRS